MSRDASAVLFDIDGTLITTGGAGAAAWDRSFEELYGVPADIERLTEAGMVDHEVLEVAFRHQLGREPDASEVARLLAGYLRHLEETVAESKGYVVHPGVRELLTRLADEGELLGLTTGNIEAAAHIKLARADLNRFFAFGGYGSDSPERSELTRIAIERAGAILGHTPATVLVVGDTPRDIAAAHAVHAVAVGVATGHYGVEELREAGADHVLRTFAADPFPLPGHR